MARRLSPETEAAIDKYGPRVRGMARKRYGITGKQLLRKLVAGESGDREDAVSPAGARGKTQFMPGTRAIAVKKYGVDPYRSTDEAVHAAVLHLKGKLTGKKGLEGYNPGDPNYPAYILGQKVKGRKGGGPVPRTGTRATTRIRTATRKKVNVEGALIDSLMSGASRKGGLLKDVSRRLDSGEYEQRVKIPKRSVSEIPGNVSRSGGKGATPKGKVTVADNANRAGVDLQPYARQFAERMAKGLDINIGTGSNHSQYTVNGKVSDHWDGSAFDIPARGPDGDKVAYRAFRAAGVPKEKARLWAKNGGLYNINTEYGRVQIIWKTQEGGNHHDHVHVGIRPR